MLKKTSFYEKHIEMGAKIVPFAGFEMPVQYSSIIAETLQVRKKVGMFDVSHMGEIEVTGPDAEKFANYITTNDVSKLNMFQVQYSTMPYPDGGIVDDLLVYKLPDKILLVVNASNTDKDFEWVVKNKRWNVNVKNKSDQYFQLAIQGPISEGIVQKIVDIDLSTISFYWASNCKIKNNNFLISRTGYTGEDGFEIYGDTPLGPEIWDMVFDAGKGFGIAPIGLGARDILRLEMRYCLYGNDIDKNTTPLEAGLGWVVKLDKGEFIGKNALMKQKQEGIKRKLVAFEMEDRLIPRHNFKIFSHSGTEIGFVTSGAWSPSIKKTIGLGYVGIENSKIGNKIIVDIRGRKEKGIIVKPPFYKNGTHK